MMLSNHLILCCPLLLLPLTFPSIRGFSNELALRIRWLNYWSFSINPSNEYSGLISFWIGWFDLLAVQITLKSLQHHSSKASILRHSAFFMVQLSHLYMTTGKTIALTGQTFIGKVMPLLFNTLSRFVIAFLTRSKHLVYGYIHNIQLRLRVAYTSVGPIVLSSCINSCFGISHTPRSFPLLCSILNSEGTTAYLLAPG